MSPTGIGVRDTVPHWHRRPRHHVLVAHSLKQKPVIQSTPPPERDSRPPLLLEAELFVLSVLASLCLSLSLSLSVCLSLSLYVYIYIYRERERERETERERERGWVGISL